MDSILQSANEIQQGEIVFDDLSFNPLVHFPQISLVLNHIAYYREKDTIGIDERTPILTLRKLYIDFNMIDLLRGEFSASTIFLEDGEFNLVLNEEGKLKYCGGDEKKPV